MSNLLPGNEPIAPDATTRRSVRGRILRLVVPISQGRGFWRKTAWIARRIALWYVIILLMLTFFQRSLIYRPTRAATVNPEESGLPADRVTQLTVPTADGLELRGWLVRAMPDFSEPAAKPQPNTAGRKPTVIYFPGNAGHRGFRGIELDLLSGVGADVYLVDYRGYGENPGHPTEEGLANDAQGIWNEVTVKRGVAPADVVVLGESLGGGVATRLVAEVCAAGTPPRGLILRSTFSSVVDIASHYYPWLPIRTLLIDRFPSTERITSVTCPILIVHGSQDTIVPPRFAKQLFDAAPAKSANGVTKTFADLPGAGHNDILYVARDPYRAAVRNFFNRLRETGLQGAHTEEPRTK